MAGVPFVGPLVRCVVCTATWVAMGAMLLLPYTTLFSTAFRVRTLVDGVVLVGWTVAASWVLGRLLGDAD